MNENWSNENCDDARRWGITVEYQDDDEDGAVVYRLLFSLQAVIQSI